MLGQTKAEANRVTIAISDDEASEYGEVAVPIPSLRVKKSLEDDEDMQDVVKDDVENGDGGGDNEQGEEGDEEAEGEDLGEDECVMN